MSLASGTYSAGQAIAVTSATPEAIVRYTINGATPTASDPIVPAGGIVVGNFTLKAIAFKTGCTTSGLVTASYQVSGTLTSARVAAGDAHSLALRADGGVWTWGANGNGQLGSGDTTNRSIPGQVTGLTGVTAVAGAPPVSPVRRSGSDGGTRHHLCRECWV